MERSLIRGIIHQTFLDSISFHPGYDYYTPLTLTLSQGERGIVKATVARMERSVIRGIIH